MEIPYRIKCLIKPLFGDGSDFSYAGLNRLKTHLLVLIRRPE